MAPASLARIKKRFASYVQLVPGGCWYWTGSRSGSGYGRFGRGYANRSSYELFVGPIPPGLMICHRCDNPPCVNPDHLFAGTAQDNALDMVKKGRTRIGARAFRELYTEEELIAKAHRTAEIRQRFKPIVDVSRQPSY